MTAGRVVVIGSINDDVILDVGHLPARGETIIARAVRHASGGKGANQAYGAVRSARDIPVVMLGAVGADSAGVRMTAELDSAGVDISGVREVAGDSGIAMIAVDDQGDNLIVVAPGANDVWPDAVDFAFAPDDVVVLQLEIPLSVVHDAARAARRAGARVVLNAAPAIPGAAALLPDVDTVVVNELEAAELLGLTAPTTADIGAASRREDVDVVVTLGADGAIACARGGEPLHIDSIRITAVDTVGAGDAFVGAFASALAAGSDLPVAARRGSAAGALTVTESGARHPALSPELIDDLLASAASTPSALPETRNQP